MFYIGKCSCGLPQAKEAASRDELEEFRCPGRKIQRGNHIIAWRKQNSTAVKPPKFLNIEESIAFSRPKRNAAMVTKRGRDEDDLDDSIRDDDGDVIAMDLDDNEDEYLPTPEFSPEMRYSQSGHFALTRLPTAPTVMKAVPWTRVTAKAGRGDTNAQFGGVSATAHGTPLCPGFVPAKSTGKTFEWCHLIADCLGGPTAANNLFCGSYHANTAMLCIEHQLVGKSHLEVRIEVLVRAGTHLGEVITYLVRVAGGTAEFSERIDALATGCTAIDAQALRLRIRDWLQHHARRKKLRAKRK